MRRDGGFMLVDVLVASSVVAVAGIAAAQALSAAQAGRQRAGHDARVADCAEVRLAEIVTGVPIISACAGLALNEVVAPTGDGTLEQVRWALRGPDDIAHAFVVIRYAR